MRAANVRFVTAGENLALARQYKLRAQRLDELTRHRANILHPQFSRVGIDIMIGGIRGLMISQEFRN
jgi:hypothetical protein